MSEHCQKCEQDCLNYEPFSGDETDVIGLSDKFVTTRKPHRCNVCWEGIPAGQRVRAKTERNNEERKVMTFYFCVECWHAMAVSCADNGAAIEKRTGMGMRAAGALPAEAA